jgi:hypothetical protein
MVDLRPRRLLPALAWLSTYRRTDAVSDAMAALIVTVMLIPQSLAYAMLAGLPAHVGLYASMLPLLGYALFGSSRTLAVGPVAVASLMTAAAVSKVAETGSDQYLAAAVILRPAVRRDAVRDGDIAPRLDRQSAIAPGDRRVYHRLGHSDCCQPAQTYSRHFCRW